MSSFSASYSSLDEVWGSDLKPKKKSVPKKPTPPQIMPKDPFCELYDISNSSKAYSENELMEYVNSATAGFDNYSKVEFSKSVPPSRDDPVPPQKIVPTKTPKHVDEDDDEDDVLDFMGYMEKKTNETINKANLPFADYGLYILSGIILIFMMEQFVKIGVAMRN